MLSLHDTALDDVKRPWCRAKYCACAESDSYIIKKKIIFKGYKQEKRAATRTTQDHNPMTVEYIFNIPTRNNYYSPISVQKPFIIVCC